MFPPRVRRVQYGFQQFLRVLTMAEAGSFADRVKQQADIVRVVGEYVRLKKSGQNFSGAVSVSFRKDAVVCRACHVSRFITASGAAWAATFSNS